MARATIRVKNLRTFLRAVNKIEREEKQRIREALGNVAEPVAESAQQKISRYPGASVGTIGPRVVTAGVFVTQRKGKVTGKRGDFGSLQMRHLVASLEAHENDVVRELEKALDDLGREAGF